MRSFTAIAIFVLGLAGVTAASAADIPVGRSVHYSGGYSAYGQRAGQLVIYDDQPGVFVRAYWRAPWRHHHYFPATGKRPRVGRRENMSARSIVKPAQSYYRYWSTSEIVLSDEP